MRRPPKAASRSRGRARAAAVLAGALAVTAALSGCGAQGKPLTTTTTASPATGATTSERRWQAEVERFAAGLVPELRRLELLTGGSPKAGVAGLRLDPRIFTPGQTRRSFTATMAAFSTCMGALDAAVPPAPTPRLRPVRVAFSHACIALTSVPALIRSDVLRASSPTKVNRGLLAAGATRAREGVRLVVGGLTTLHRLLGPSSKGKP